MNPNIGLSKKSLHRITTDLHQLLADETVLAALTRVAHWNVAGPLFGPLHELFGKQYSQLDATIDEVAERIRALGRPVEGRLRDLVRASAIDDFPELTGNPEKLIHTLLEGHEKLIRSLRAVIQRADEDGDAGTADFLTGVLEAHETTAWMLRVSIE